MKLTSLSGWQGQNEASLVSGPFIPELSRESDEIFETFESFDLELFLTKRITERRDPAE